MGHTAITDTGYVTTDKSGTQFTGDDIVNSGDSIVLRTASLDYVRGANFDNNSQPATYTDTELNFTAFSNPMIIARGIFNNNDSNDMDTILLLDQMCKTKGIKLIYYNADDGYRELTNSLGILDSHNGVGTGDIPTNIKHLHIRFKSFTIKQNADKKRLNYELKGEITA